MSRGRKAAERGRRGPAGKAADGPRGPGEPEAPPAPEPVDVADGIPDRDATPKRWIYVAILTVFLAWLAFLIYCAAAGRV